MFCKNCGNECIEGAAICTKCGFAIGTGEHYCAKCGGTVEPGQAVCINCGCALIEADASLGKSSKSKLAAGLLGIFLGAYGVHNFYLGKTKRAIIQIIVNIVTCGIGGIWGFIEGILILVGNPKYCIDSEGKPLSD